MPADSRPIPSRPASSPARRLACAASAAGFACADIQVIDVPFAVASDFVYHCHVLEHEESLRDDAMRAASKPR